MFFNKKYGRIDVITMRYNFAGFDDQEKKRRTACVKKNTGKGIMWCFYRQAACYLSRSYFAMLCNVQFRAGYFAAERCDPTDQRYLDDDVQCILPVAKFLSCLGEVGQSICKKPVEILVEKQPDRKRQKGEVHRRQAAQFNQVLFRGD
jgi:hypothetical protein